MTIEELIREATATAKEKGFHDTPRSVGDDIALIHSEASEALEDYRVWGEEALAGDVWWNTDNPEKPEGFIVELMDILIRVCETIGRRGITIEKVEYALRKKLEYNRTRSQRHGGKIL